MRWYFNGAKVELKLGATCPTSGICNGDTRYMFTNFRKKIAMKARFAEKKNNLRANTPCLKSLLAYAYTVQCAACIT